MVWGAHIAGIPVEETALSFAPVIVATGGVASVKLRAQLARRRMRTRRRAEQAAPDGGRR
jgi:hypothetical protein